ncbi:ubiquitin carboxyl-terminal hydrolase [Limtongia smithiae]|uniref:ubiquitin carboxyl-terminal hydrolase n=1 Tax=Limtongia smithiae TaxID=1125753 RepID=UPI0034CD7EA2
MPRQRNLSRERQAATASARPSLRRRQPPRNNSRKLVKAAAETEPSSDSDKLTSIDYVSHTPADLLREKLEDLRWATVESDPGIFTQIAKDAGVRGIKVEELYAIEPESIENLPHTYGLVFLFRWKEEDDDEDKNSDTPELSSPGPAQPWFANQVIDNACASLALLNIFLNISPAPNSIDLGEHLRQFRNFTASFNPVLRGLALSNFAFLRRIHNKFARASELRESNIVLYKNALDFAKNGPDNESDQNTAADDDFHFIAYVPLNGHLWELDGLSAEPHVAGVIPPGSSWAETATKRIQERIERYSSAEIRFNLMAVVQDRTYEMELERERLEKVLRAAEASDRSASSDDIPVLQEIPFMTEEDLQTLISNTKKEINSLDNNLMLEQVQTADSQLYATRRQYEYAQFLRDMIAMVVEQGDGWKLIMENLKSQ